MVAGCNVDHLSNAVKYMKSILHNLSLISGLPYLHTKTHVKRSTGSGGESERLYDDFNITSLPRSILPHLVVQNHRHVLPPSAAHNVMLEGHDNEDDRLLRRLHEIKVNTATYTCHESETITFT